MIRTYSHFLTVIRAFNCSSHSYIHDKNNVARNIRNFSDYYLFHVLFLLLFLSPSFLAI